MEEGLTIGDGKEIDDEGEGAVVRGAEGADKDDEMLEMGVRVGLEE